jgi:hypothetical protein
MTLMNDEAEISQKLNQFINSTKTETVRVLRSLSVCKLDYYDLQINLEILKNRLNDVIKGRCMT